MDYEKIGNFIAEERKAKKLTQAKLAEKLSVSEKTVSKWENGRGIPDTENLPKLCEIFDISINEILNGERFSSEDYKIKAEEKLLELQRQKTEGDKRLLNMEIVIGVICLTFYLPILLLAAYLDMPVWLKITLIVGGFIVFIVAMLFAIRIEQKAGYYLCEKCNHKYVPKFNQVLWSMHVNRTRYMKCPNCKKRSWQKKVVK